MATKKGLRNVFVLWMAAGLAKPRDWKEIGPEAVMTLWMDICSGFSDAELRDAAYRIVDGPKPWWAKPGELKREVRHLTGDPWPRIARALMDAEELKHGPSVCWDDERLASVTRDMVRIRKVEEDASRFVSPYRHSSATPEDRQRALMLIHSTRWGAEAATMWFEEMAKYDWCKERAPWPARRKILAEVMHCARESRMGGRLSREAAQQLGYTVDEPKRLTDTNNNE